MTRCPICSGENADTQRFCGECGTPLPASVRSTPARLDADETLPLPSAELASGTLFARRYQVIEELGVGGMGRVYRVLDRKVNEEIALKLIRPEVAADRSILERFSSELKLARQVVHHNVARMFDLNEEGHVPYITMEYVQGENLKRLIRKVGRLNAGQAIPIARQICDGLAEAHRLGIVHRDLKPQNIMIDEEGRAKIMDFGLARLLESPGKDDPASRSGTPAYVSPEQIRGLPLDGRSDLYSLGVVLFEMLTGQTPFKAASVEELVEMHLHEPPPDPRKFNADISVELSRVVMKCLEKDPAKRYQTADETRQALAELGGRVGTPPWVKALRIAGAVGALAAAALVVGLILRQRPWESSLAVLPVEISGVDEEHQNIISELQNEITGRLTDIPRLRVPPVLSVNSYNLEGKNSPQIGKLLGVRYLLKLKVAVEGDMVDAKIYLIDARRDLFLPPMTYPPRAVTDYRVLQDEIARYTAGALGVAIAEERLEKIGRRGTDNIEAYNLYLEGMSLIEKHHDEENILKAIAKQERAIAIDPNYALAYWGAGIANENLYYLRSEVKDPVVLEKMYTFFRKASDLDPTFAETNLGLGWYYFNKGDNPRAYDSFKKALELEPRKYTINLDAGAFLRSIGLYEQAIRYISKAAELSPRAPQPLAQLAQAWLYLGRTEKALEYAKRAVAVDPGNEDGGIMFALLLMLTERIDEAESEINALVKIGVPADRLRMLREQIAALRGDRSAAASIRGKLSNAPHGTYAYLLFDMKDEAIANLQAGIDRGFWHGMYFYSYPSLVKNPWYKDLRRDPRFRAILERQKEIYLRELKPLEKL